MKKIAFSQSVTAKILFVGFLAILMLIPVSMVQNVIQEREWRYEEATREVSAKWGYTQEISGPILTIPYTYRWEQKVGTSPNEQTLERSEIRQAHFFPESLHYKAHIEPQTRKRGIFEVVLYTLKLKVSGNFATPNMAELDIKDQDILWGESFLTIGIPDTRGIQERIPLQWNNQTLFFDPHVGDMSFLTSGIHTSLTNFSEGTLNTFSFDLDLKGSQELKFWPTGKETTAQVTSSWPAPSFNGYFLPEQNDDNQTFEDGFEARWKMSYFGRSYPQSWKSPQNQTHFHEVTNTSFGLQLLLPVDFYKKNERSIKYAVLFIGLTFLMFFCFEILHKGLRVHPFQYILVGISMSVFYLLLLSLSEHIGFDYAYIISSLATISLITFYSSFVLKAREKARGVGLVLLLIYAYLYTLLQLQDYALLLGSIVTFLILAIVMWVTRKIDWYKIEVNGD